MNWYRQVLYWISIIALSYFSYIHFISKRENILPDFSSISNELWIIILIFLFDTFNRVTVSQTRTKERKENYLKNRYNSFRERFSHIVDDNVKSDKLKAIIYAIMIYEDFNRPKAARIIENMSFFITRKGHSLGLMQVQTNTFIDDIGSVELGINKIKTAYSNGLKEKMLEKKEDIVKFRSDAWHIEMSLERNIIRDYNPDDNYIEEVKELSGSIFNNLMSGSKTYLFPGYDGNNID